MPLVQILGAFARYRCPCPAIPQHDCAAAILALGNGAFERAITDRMVLCAHRQPFVVGVKAWPSSYRPTFEYAVDLQPEIPVQPRCVMFLHDKAITLAFRPVTRRFCRFLEVAFSVV